MANPRYDLGPDLLALADLLVVLDEEIAHKVREHLDRHVAGFHRSGPEAGVTEWLPFAQRHIPDAQLVQMIEALETDPEADVRGVADQFGYPTSLVESHLAAYQQRYYRALRELAGRRS